MLKTKGPIFAKNDQRQSLDKCRDWLTQNKTWKLVRSEADIKSKHMKGSAQTVQSDNHECSVVACQQKSIAVTEVFDSQVCC